MRAERGGFGAMVLFLGPAFVVSVAYVDPGNFATSMAAGTRFGYALGWVVAGASVMAVLVQVLSARLGMVTGLSLPQVCRERLPRWIVLLLWGQAEAVAIATDVAEFTGAAVGLSLVSGLPLWAAALLAGVAVSGVLGLEARGFRRVEAVIMVLVAVVTVAFGAEVLLCGPEAGEVAAGVLVPRLPGGAALLAVGIVGATVMPHAVYLHSALAARRVTAVPVERRALRLEAASVLCAMGVTGLVNLAMLATAAAVFFPRAGAVAGQDLDQVAAGLDRFAGGHAGMLFGVALLFSGVASSSAGTMAGQVVMDGFLRRRVPLAVRRGVTMLPALLLLALGFSPVRAMIWSQVFLSFGIPFALIPLAVFTATRSVMGTHVSRPVTTFAACATTAVIMALNIYLLTAP